MRPLSFALSLLVALSSCAVPVPKAQPVARPSPLAAASILERCRDLAMVDMARLPRSMPEWERFEQFHREVRTGIPIREEQGDTRLKLAIPGGSFRSPYGLSVWAARQPGGAWRVSHILYLQLPPPPQPPGAAQLPLPPQRVVKTGTLTAAAGEMINAALASACLKREPYLSPAVLPMKNGVDSPCPPDAGGSNALEIIEGSDARRYLRECGRTWASGAIIIALENPANIQRD